MKATPFGDVQHQHTYLVKLFNTDTVYVLMSCVWVLNTYSHFSNHANMTNIQRSLLDVTYINIYIFFNFYYYCLPFCVVVFYIITIFIVYKQVRVLKKCISPICHGYPLHTSSTRPIYLS